MDQSDQSLKKKFEEVRRRLDAFSQVVPEKDDIPEYFFAWESIIHANDQLGEANSVEETLDALEWMSVAAEAYYYNTGTDGGKIV